MSVAGELAQANEEKAKLCKELEEKSIEKKNLEKRIEWLKSKLDPLLKVGERIGIVEKLEVEKLNIGPELLAELVTKYGPEVERRECNVKVLREKMAETPDELKKLPVTKSEQIRVGEKWGK
jgi:hypothetical protein